MKHVLIAVATVFAATSAQAWSACGHHIVALIAYERLQPAEREALLELLTHHPRYAEDFAPPEGVRDADRYRIGRAGYWPDVARSQPESNRPDWHWELGATKVIGDIEPPAGDTELPADATLDTQELHVVQAIKLCRRVMGDQDAPAAERAIALCWLAHLVGDVHQPCHAGSLYVEGVFPEGDRGANSIPTTQSRNLHALWDGLLGRRFDEGDVERRLQEIVGDEELATIAKRAVTVGGALNDVPLYFEGWVAESRQFSERLVYAGEVLGPVRAVANGRTEEVPEIRLSPEYLEAAGRIARIRVAQAGARLALVWRGGLGGSDAYMD